MYTEHELKQLTVAQVTTLSLDVGDLESSTRPQSMMKLGICKLYGYSTNKDALCGIDLLFALFLSGKNFYLDAFKEISKYFARSETLAVVQHYKALASKKDPEVLTILGWCYILSSERSLAHLSFSYFDHAANMDYLPAIFARAKCYEEGFGIDMNIPKAYEDYHHAFQHNYVPGTPTLHHFTSPHLQSSIYPGNSRSNQPVKHVPIEDTADVLVSLQSHQASALSSRPLLPSFQQFLSLVTTGQDLRSPPSKESDLVQKTSKKRKEKKPSPFIELDSP